MRAWRGFESLFGRGTIETFWTQDEDTPGSTWALGWDTPSASESSAGSLVGRPAVGHLGFTGTSVWIDLVRGVHVVLLTNRLEAGRDNSADPRVSAAAARRRFLELRRRRQGTLEVGVGRMWKR